jgi:regulator of replication initiation timing
MTQTEQLILENAELKLENKELKKLLKESFETFPTKRLADRIYSIDGIERPEPEPLPLNVDEEIPF